MFLLRAANGSAEICEYRSRAVGAASTDGGRSATSQHPEMGGPSQGRGSRRCTQRHDHYGGSPTSLQVTEEEFLSWQRAFEPMALRVCAPRAYSNTEPRVRRATADRGAEVIVG